MADWQQQQRHECSNINASSWPRTRSHSQTCSDDLNPLYYEPRMFQLPMNFDRDDPGDGMTIDITSNRGSTSDSIWSFVSERDINEFIREFNGRRYNTQNTTYFLPAGQSESQLPILQPCLSPSPGAFSQESPHSRPLPFVQIKSSTAACAYPNPCFPSIPYITPRSVTSNIFAIAFVLASCTHIPIWSTSSYGLNPVLRRRFSI